jgi:quercetin dioxygenase-like cupin family protein
MRLTRRNEGREERSNGWGSQPGVRLSWLIDSELGGSEHGAVGRMRVDRGGAQASHRHPRSEEATLVLSGRGAAVVAAGEQPLEQGNVLYAPAGATHAVLAGEEPLDLLVVTAAADAEAASWEEGAGSDDGPRARVLTGLEADEQELDDASIGFLGMHARWLVEAGVCGSDSIVVGRSRFAPRGGVHELHRHPRTAEFFIVLEGEGAHLDEDGSEVPVEPGDAALLEAGSWHGFRNKGSEEARAVFGFLDVPSLDDAGYELPEG